MDGTLGGMKRLAAITLVVFAFACQEDDDVYTAQDCQEDGGTVVADIGDGAIYQDDYRCPNGSPPLRSITAEDGGPSDAEGAVCCGS